MTGSDTGASLQVRARTSSLNLVTARVGVEEASPWELNAQELESVAHRQATGFCFGHLQPDVRQDRTDEAVSSLGLPAPIVQDHEVVGAADHPEPGCSHSTSSR